jgi:hypothetical protein
MGFFTASNRKGARLDSSHRKSIGRSTHHPMSSNAPFFGIPFDGNDFSA